MIQFIWEGDAGCITQSILFLTQSALDQHSKTQGKERKNQLGMMTLPTPVWSEGSVSSQTGVGLRAWLLGGSFGCHMLGLFARGVWDGLAACAALNKNVEEFSGEPGRLGGPSPLHFHLSAHSIV